MSHIDNQMILF